MPRPRFIRQQRTAQDRRSALVGLLYGCTPEQLPTFTAESLNASYGVPVKDCAEMLVQARASRSVRLA